MFADSQLKHVIWGWDFSADRMPEFLLKSTTRQSLEKMMISFGYDHFAHYLFNKKLD